MSISESRKSSVPLLLFFCCSICVAQSPGNFGGDTRPWVTLDAAFHSFADRSHFTISAGLTPYFWSMRNVAVLQGTIGFRDDPESTLPMPWRFTLLDVDRELKLDKIFDWDPYRSYGAIVPTVVTSE